MKKALIIGAGPAGLTAAYELLKKGKNVEVVVFEESDCFGGISRTVEYKGNRIYVKIPDIYLSDESIAGHMSAIYNILALIGNFVDVNIELPNYSIFYCLTAYSRGNNHSVKVTRDFINERLCKVAYTLKMRNYGDDVLEEVEDNGTD